MKRFSIASIWGSAWAPIGSVVLALVIAGVMMALTNSNPLYAYRALFEGAGFRVETVELDAIEAAGGSLRCCVGEIF